MITVGLTDSRYRLVEVRHRHGNAAADALELLEGRAVVRRREQVVGDQSCLEQPLELGVGAP